MLSVKNATTINRKPLKRVRELFDLTKGYRMERSVFVTGCKRPPFRKRSDCSVALFNIFRYLADNAVSSDELGEKSRKPLQTGLAEANK
ncbi:hypothetical protein TcasGA2_TC013164 [Tribolium castaneum]|uniref:Uncharacterized protein n=1 Tax=Tribolium castaneum TaxID=7070 RepID=D6WND3_TRICA|nr:hypothetical protein TcasGA2_TC013164 [Tribolium castaneum]